ncbi:serine hydrolase domain-containing protein [Kitasatospora sp. NPDC001539]|uniref:serine hydrolase domain-containing protein n=1 Tax=Kitasatospora sp. NPDC001539 TaxID=3154384 RepID=UPI00332A31F3
MRIRLAVTTVALATALAAGAAAPAIAARPASGAPMSATPTVQDILGRLPDDVVAGALIRRDGVGATAGPVTADAYLRIGSVTKVFTNTVVLQLVAEHRIGLDTPARRYVPEVLPEAYAGVTVRQLLDHTSGLPKPAGTPGPADGPGWQLKSVAPGDFLRESFAAAADEVPPATPAAQQYNGLNSLVLGLIVEKVTGRSFTAELERRIIRPLHLSHTSLPAADDPALPSPHAEVYLDGQDVTEQSPYPWAEGGMISTAADLDRFLTALFRGRLLPPAQQELVFEVPDVSNGVDNTNCVKDPCYSVGGLMRYQLPNGEYVWGKTGSRPGWDNGFFATRDLRHRLEYSLNPTGAGNDLPYIKALVNAGLAD